MKNYNYKTVLNHVMRELGKVGKNGKQLNLKNFKNGLFRLVSGYENLTKKEVSDLVNSIYNMVKSNVTEANFKGQNTTLLYKDFDKLYRVCRKLSLNKKDKSRVDSVRAMIKGGDNIFFMCSKHYPVAEDHREWQGKLYVDKGWRTKVSGRYYRAVSEYIKTNEIMTIQGVMENPPYLITRPNCRHKLVVVPVLSVVSGNDLSSYVKVSHSKKMYDRNKDYYDYRDGLYQKYSILNKKS